MDYPIHPAAELFPMMGDGELADLAASIKKNGLQHPVLLHEGQIIDGRNRLEACARVGVRPGYREALFTCDPFEWVWATNAERRMLTADQRATIRAIVLEKSGEWARLQAEAKAEADRARAEQQRGRPRGERRGPNGPTRSEPAKKRARGSAVAKKVAAEINVDAKKVEAAHRLAVEAPALAEQVARGEKKLCEATAEAFPKPKAPPPPAPEPEPEPVEVEEPPLVIEELTFHGGTARLVRERANAAGVSVTEWAWTTIKEAVDP